MSNKKPLKPGFSGVLFGLTQEGQKPKKSQSNTSSQSAHKNQMDQSSISKVSNSSSNQHFFSEQNTSIEHHQQQQQNQSLNQLVQSLQNNNLPKIAEVQSSYDSISQQEEKTLSFEANPNIQIEQSNLSSILDKSIDQTIPEEYPPEEEKNSALDLAYDQILKEGQYLSDTEKSTLDSTNQSTHFQAPREYQTIIVQKIKDQWNSQETKKYGSIVFIETGSGKTYIAIMVIKHILEDETSMEPLTASQIDRKRDDKKKKILSSKDHAEFIKNKVVYLTPTNNLVDQQANVIDKHTNLIVGKFHGGDKYKKFYKRENWSKEYELHDVFVFNSRKFYDLLMHGQIRIENIGLLIFDECHHTDQNHLYNLIMQDFFFNNFDPNDTNMQRPHILALTASPIKQKLDSKANKDDIEKMLQTLCNNLYSKFVSISQSELNTIKNNCKIEPRYFEQNFGNVCQWIKDFEEKVIKQLLSLINSPNNQISYTTQDTLMAGVKNSMLNDVALENDVHLLKFINGRKNLIDLDTQFTKQSIDLTQFKDPETKILIIFSIILLKNVNNLLLELGPRSIQAFLEDLQLTILKKNEYIKKSGPKVANIIDNYLNVMKTYNNQQFQNYPPQQIQNSPKVDELVNILRSTYLERISNKQQLKTIIFVKNRSVAFYLRKILEQELNNRSLIANENKDRIDLNSLDSQRVFDFRIGFAMGQKGRNIVNKAYKSTNVKKLDVTNDIQKFINYRGGQSIQMNNEQLMETLQNFKKGGLNLLIATNVVEEGLDVSTCNQVICLNELMTVKSFIQMKGRARQKDSQFIFLSSKEEKENVELENERFKRAIDYMEEIAYREQKELNRITPNFEEIKESIRPKDEMLEIVETGARVTQRDAKQFLEEFCVQLNQDKKIELANLSINDPSLRSENGTYLATNKPIFDAQEAVHPGQDKKFFICILKVPITLKGILDPIIRPKTGFSKKRDAENHVALEALKQIYQKGFFDQYLYPIIPSKQPQKSSSNKIAQKPHQSSIQESEKVQAAEEQKQFHETQKRDKSKAFLHVDQSYRNFMSEPLQIQIRPDSQQKLYVHIMRGVDQSNNYPFKTTKDFLGILYDRTFKSLNISYKLQQEKRQKEKNIEYLRNLFKHDEISQEQKDLMIQDQDELVFQLDRDNVIEISFENQSEEHLMVQIQKLRFYHTWLFYYMFSADHKFIQQILKQKFIFAKLLFNDLIKLVNRNKFWIENVYSKNTVDKNGYLPDYTNKQRLTAYPFVVPVKCIKRNGQDQYIINFDLIDGVINHIKTEVMKLYSGENIHNVTDKFHLEGDIKQNKKSMLKRVWNCELNGIRHVMDDNEFKSSDWQQKLVILQNKRQKTNNNSFLNSSEMSFSHYNFQQSSNFSQLLESSTFNEQRFSVSEHYFSKCGTFLRKRDNKFIAKCRKERHFLDMNKQSQVQDEFAKKAQRKKFGQDEEQGHINSIFDVPDQFLNLSPVSYDQYQILQTACSQLSIFNEYLQAEKFILDRFQNSRCFVNISTFKRDEKRCQDVFRITAIDGNEIVSDQLLKNNKIIMEALTAPTASREYDYERLEFYGDSVISFLVILELFLTKQEIEKEGDLDFYRIKAVSNMNFIKTNKKFGFFKYMIVEPQKIFSDFTPAGFENLNYHQKIKQKNLNELNNKYRYLKNYQYHLGVQDNLKQEEEFMSDFYPVVCKFIKRNDLLFRLYEKYPIVKSKIKHLTKYKVNALQIMKEMISCKIGPRELKLISLENCIYKIGDLKKFNKYEKEKNNKHYNKKQNSKLFFFKQLADVVESVAGAVTQVCGLNSTQDYLKNIEILKSDQSQLQKNYIEYIKLQDSKRVQYEEVYRIERMEEVEKKIGYTFNKKFLIVQALTHKSYNEQNISSNQSYGPLEDYEKLEFLGDSILNFLIAQYFYQITLNDKERKMPKELHKMKTSVVNNALLSLIVIENGLQNYVIYNEKAQQFKEQFDFYIKYVGELIDKNGTTKQLSNSLKQFQQQQVQLGTVIQENHSFNLQAEPFSLEASMIKKQIQISQGHESFNPEQSSMMMSTLNMLDGKTIQDQLDLDDQDLQIAPSQVPSQYRPIDIDLLYEHNLKIFGDVFESLIGAIFLDSQSIDTTWTVLFNLINPYIIAYANLDTMQDHSRTKLLELWNSKHYTKKMKCYHKNERKNNGDIIVLKGYIDDTSVLEIEFNKDAKNKPRAFYKIFYSVIEAFLIRVDKLFEKENENYEFYEDDFFNELKKFKTLDVYKKLANGINKK